MSDNRAARLITLIAVVCIPLALLAGRWSDRARRPRLPLTLAAGGASLGLAFMAFSQDLQTGTVGYILFGLMAGVFLALHSSQTLRVLPRTRTRGRDLGIFNLTNTVPSLIMPWLVLALQLELALVLLVARLRQVVFQRPYEIPPRGHFPSNFLRNDFS